MPKMPHFIFKMFKNNRKGQMDAKELVLTLVMAGILFIVTVLIFANVSNSTDSIFDPDSTRTSNESATITVTLTTDSNRNTTTLGEDGFITNSEVVLNSSSDQLTRDTDYSITLINGASGALTTLANLTVLNMGVHNGSELFISYNTNEQSAAQASNITIQSNVLDAFELGVIALIVLAAVVILAILFRLGTG